MTNVAQTKTQDAIAAPKPWRELFPVHPCADIFPMLPAPEIEKLAADIEAQGLRSPIAIWREHEDAPWQLLDGRNRLAALTRIPAGDLSTDAFIESFCRRLPADIDPVAFVISANIRRRHLTKQQQAALILRTLEAAKTTDSATVARSVPRKANGQIKGSAKDPVLAAAVTEGAKHGISKRTIQVARAKVQQGKTPARRKPTKKAASTTRPPSVRAVDADWVIRRLTQELEIVCSQNATLTRQQVKDLEALAAKLTAILDRVDANDARTSDAMVAPR